MARSYARVLCSIWDDPDFTALPAGAQRLYILLLSSRDIDPCGVIAHRPKVWAARAHDTTPANVARDLKLLAAARFVLVDHDTDEVLVRSFLRHEVVSSPNMLKSAGRRYAAITSTAIRDAVLQQVPEPLREGFPKGFPELSPKGIGQLLREGSPEPHPKGSLDHYRNPEPGTRNPEPETRNPSGNPSGTTAAAAANEVVGDEETTTPPATPDGVADLLANYALQRATATGTTVHDPAAYAAGTRRRVLTNPALHDTITRNPDWTTERIAAAINDEYRAEWEGHSRIPTAEQTRTWLAQHEAHQAATAAEWAQHGPPDMSAARNAIRRRHPMGEEGP